MIYFTMLKRKEKRRIYLGIQQSLGETDFALESSKCTERKQNGGLGVQGRGR